VQETHLEHVAAETVAHEHQLLGVHAHQRRQQGVGGAHAALRAAAQLRRRGRAVEGQDRGGGKVLRQQLRWPVHGVAVRPRLAHPAAVVRPHVEEDQRQLRVVRHTVEIVLGIIIVAAASGAAQRQCRQA
jgi:hypothetical protein